MRIASTLMLIIVGLVVVVLILLIVVPMMKRDNKTRRYSRKHIIDNMAKNIALAQLLEQTEKVDAELNEARNFSPALSAKEWQRFEKVYTETFDRQRRLEDLAAGDRDSAERAVTRNSYVLDEIRRMRGGRRA